MKIAFFSFKIQFKGMSTDLKLRNQLGDRDFSQTQTKRAKVKS